MNDGVVENVGIEAAVTGKNLLGGRYYHAEYSRNIPFIKNKEAIELPFAPTHETGGVCKVAKCQKGQTYTFSCTNANKNATCSISEYDSIDSAMNHLNAIGFIQVTHVVLEVSYTAKSDGILVCGIAGAWTNGSTTIHECTESELLQLELGSSATSYEPYRGRQTVILASNGLPGIPVTSGGNYTDADGQQWVCDTVEYRNGQAVYVQRVWSKTFTGGAGESWLAYNHVSYHGFYIRTLPESMSRRDGLCNLLNVHVKPDETKEGLWLGVDGKGMYVVRSSFYDATLEDKGLANWKAYLAAHPMTVMTYLTTPVETPLTDTEAAQLSALHTYKPTTTITNDAGAGMDVTYVADAKTYISDNYLPRDFAVANSWADVQSIVRQGLGPMIFPVGYELTTHDSNTGQDIVWVVRGHNHHKAANKDLKYTMTLETKNVYSLSSGAQKAVQYDAIEAFYYAEQELAAGTYNITIANQAWYTADNGKTFQFTLATAVPAGGQLVFAMTYNATLEGKSVKSYANKTTTTALETVTLTEGSEGTSLGTTNGNSPNVNHMHRIVFGSNNYAQSAVRQWLNSAAAAGSVWTPTNVFDRPASWATSYNGFMHGLPADFLAVVQPAVLACRTNSLFEVESLDGTAFAINQLYSLKADKFFLLSRPEIFGDWDSASYKDGTQLEFYNGLTATERIKRDVAGTARIAWLRSPNPSYANGARVVDPSGKMSGNYAYYDSGLAPACIIA